MEASLFVAVFSLTLLALPAVDAVSVVKAPQEKMDREIRRSFVTMWYQAPEDLIQMRRAKTNINRADQRLIAATDALGNSRKALRNLLTSLWSVGSQYPVTVVTNVPEILNEFQVQLNESKLIIVPIRERDIVRLGCTYHVNHISYARWQYTFQKLQVFSLHQYDKLLWLDSDVVATQNVDSLFDMQLSNEESIIAQANNWKNCTDTALEKKKGLCSGIFLFKPSMRIYESLVQKLRVPGRCPWSDQPMIRDLFNSSGHQVRMFSKEHANFQHCSSSARLVHQCPGPDEQEM